jgi:hypothetical protein
VTLALNDGSEYVETVSFDTALRMTFGAGAPGR